jgi:hypothetical protein
LCSVEFLRVLERLKASPLGGKRVLDSCVLEIEVEVEDLLFLCSVEFLRVLERLKASPLGGKRVLDSCVLENLSSSIESD